MSNCITILKVNDILLYPVVSLFSIIHYLQIPKLEKPAEPKPEAPKAERIPKPTPEPTPEPMASESSDEGRHFLVPNAITNQNFSKSLIHRFILELIDCYSEPY